MAPPNKDRSGLSQSQLAKALGYSSQQAYERALRTREKVRITIDPGTDDYVRLVQLATNQGRRVQDVLKDALALYFYSQSVIYCPRCKAPVDDEARLLVVGEIELTCLVCKSVFIVEME